MVYYEGTSRRRLGGVDGVGGWAVHSRAGLFDDRQREDQSGDPWQTAFVRARVFWFSNLRVLVLLADILPLSGLRSAHLHCQAPVALGWFLAVTLKRAKARNPRAIVHKSPFAIGRREHYRAGPPKSGESSRELPKITSWPRRRRTTATTTKPTSSRAFRSSTAAARRRSWTVLI